MWALILWSKVKSVSFVLLAAPWGLLTGIQGLWGSGWFPGTIVLWVRGVCICLGEKQWNFGVVDEGLMYLVNN